MHILHLYKDYYPVLGGIENHIRLLAEAQVRRQHQVTVLVTSRDRRTVEENLNGVRVIKAGRLATVASTPLSPALVGLLQAQQPDIVHLQAPYPVGEIAHWLVSRKRPYIVSYQADINRLSQRLIMLAYGPLFISILRHAAAVLATSPNFAAHSPYLQRVADRIVIVPLGIDTDRFSPRSAAAPSPAGPPGGAGPLGGAEPLTLLYVGQLRHYKGVADLLQALSLIPLSKRPRLLLSGNGPMRAEWEALSQSLNLQSHATFLGNVPEPDLPALYRSADIFVLPSTSRAESFGMVLVEAMASGLPCLTTEIASGNSYVVQDGVTGLVVAPRSPAALAQALTRLIEDPALRAQMGQAGRERALREFTRDTMVDRVDKVYRTVLGT
jgi:glycosyltransferase involved in cell wall biosynthesis